MNRIILIPAAVLALSAIPAHAAPGATQETARYDVQVDGMSCPFCVRGLEKKLRALPGAEHIHVDLAKGLARLESTAAFPPESLDKAVREAGFSPRAIHMNLQGTVQGSAEHPRILIGEGKSLALAGGRQFDRLQALVAAGTRAVVLKGEARRETGGWQLSVEGVEEVRP